LGGVIAMDVVVVGDVREDVVGEIVDVGSCPCRIIIVPVGIENALPDSQQLVLFGPQQYIIVPSPTFSPPRHGNKTLPNSNEELPSESQPGKCYEGHLVTNLCNNYSTGNSK
jgi:hypothetical protein